MLIEDLDLGLGCKTQQLITSYDPKTKKSHNQGL